MKFVGFDLEIAEEVGEDDDWEKHWPLGITCAALKAQGDSRAQLWFNGMYGNPESPYYGPRMTAEQCRELVMAINGLVEEGFTLLTWNGLGFDFRVLAEESGMWKECGRLALNSHVDMMFQFLCQRGFGVSLESVSETMGVGQKTEGVDGSLAPKIWKEDPQLVLEYVEGDVDLTLDIEQAVSRRRAIHWTSRSDRHQFEPVGRWKTVAQCLSILEPDTSWMSDPDFWAREKFYGWIKKA